MRSRRERAQVEEQLKLRYYYGGKGVLSLRTSQGIVIGSVVEPDGDNFRGVPLRETLAEALLQMNVVVPTSVALRLGT